MLLFYLHVGKLFPHIIVWLADFSQSGVLVRLLAFQRSCSLVHVLEVFESLDTCCQAQTS